MHRLFLPTCLILACALALGCGDDSESDPSLTSCDTSDVRDALAGTCASGLGDLLTCWAPAGNCTANIELSGDFDIVFDNGAVLETRVDGTSGSGRYVNSGGMQCGTFDVPSGSTRVDVMTNGGESFSIGTDGDVRCDNGDTVPLDDIQQRALNSCAGANATTCTQPDIGDVPDIPDAGDLMCTSDDECPRIGGEQWRCCLSVPGTSQRFCSSPQACAFL